MRKSCRPLIDDGLQSIKSGIAAIDVPGTIGLWKSALIEIA